MKEFAQAEWERAQSSFAAAEQVAAIDPNSAASRAYYAAFHAVSALFALRGQSFSKHSAVRAAVYRDLVNTGLWPPELGQTYDSLLLLRTTGDYGGLADVSPEDAAIALVKAKRILDAVKQMCPELEKAN